MFKLLHDRFSIGPKYAIAFGERDANFNGDGNQSKCCQKKLNVFLAVGSIEL